MKRKTNIRISTLILSLLTTILLAYTGCEKIGSTDIDTIENLPDITGFPLVGTNQTTYFNNFTSISAPSEGEDFYGQNAHFPGNEPQYVDNGDGTVTDMVTGLMWQSSFDHNGDAPLTMTTSSAMKRSWPWRIQCQLRDMMTGVCQQSKSSIRLSCSVDAISVDMKAAPLMTWSPLLIQNFLNTPMVIPMPANG